MGAQNIANGSASLEPDFSANTINTTWYSNGTQLTGDNIPATCTYDTALIPPTPAARPGYEFNGWKIKRCEIPSTDVSTNGNAYAAKKLDGGNDSTSGGATAATYGITQPGEWGVSWSSGDKVVGEAICSQTSGRWATTGTPDTTGTGETKYCWCRATHYTANNAQQCTLSSPAWVFSGGDDSANCARDCASGCAGDVRFNSVFRVALFTGLVAQ